MTACVTFIWFIGLLYASDGKSFNFQFDPIMEINETCNQLGWTCQRLRDCPPALTDIKQGKKPQLCCFDNLESIVCCPKTPMKQSVVQENTKTKTFKVCQIYAGRHCTYPYIGGVTAKPREFPHMALIGYGEDPKDISWQCGGTLISERYVLSAAHCTFPGVTSGPANYIRLGDLDTATDTDDAITQEFRIIERINHPGYKPTEVYNDIALYKLDRDARFLRYYVSPVCLYDKPTLPEDPVIGTGWGRIEFVGPVSTQLLKARLRLFDERECKRFWNSTSPQLPRGIDWNSMMCAGEKDGSVDACQGDSGGPLTLVGKHYVKCLAQQVAITSFGRLCGLADSPGIYTRVYPYLPWIESIVWPYDV